MITTIKPAGPVEYDDLMRIWESAVRATHHFLKEEDLAVYKSMIPGQLFPQVSLWGLWDEQDVLQGFAGVSGDTLEMLFIDAAARGKGYGKSLLQFVLKNFDIKKVDVNEQNEQALQFYISQGFSVYARSEKDGMGKDYPILHLQVP